MPDAGRCRCHRCSLSLVPAMAAKLFPYFEMLLWLLLVMGVRPVSVENYLPALPEVALAGTDDVEALVSSDRPSISISAVNLDAEGVNDYRVNVDQHPLLFHLLQPINSEASYQAFLDRLQKSTTVDLTPRKRSDESVESPPCTNGSSPCVFMEIVKKKVPEISKTSLKPLSPFTICAIVISILIIIVAGVWYVGKHYVVRYWNMMQLLLQWETEEVIERRQNIHEMISRPISLPA